MTNGSSQAAQKPNEQLSLTETAGIQFTLPVGILGYFQNTHCLSERKSFFIQTSWF